MEECLVFDRQELREIAEIARRLRETVGCAVSQDDEKALRRLIGDAVRQKSLRRDSFGLNPVLSAFRTAELEEEEIGMRRDSVLAILLFHIADSRGMTEEQIGRVFGGSVAQITLGLIRVRNLFRQNKMTESENLLAFMLSSAEDMRVILIMIAARASLMRQIRDTKNDSRRRAVAEEAGFLYAPLAHKLGLYKIKSELEDLSLKYLEHDAYYMIKDKLNATKKTRDAYIGRFIKPVGERLAEAGIVCHIKGRTKSIHSIWQKMKKQKCGFEGIYDLFAIRIIIASPPAEECGAARDEHAKCWHAFGIVTSMYKPNEKRLRDWLSVPKPNGYESLHITVLGPENKWVEVQIRTERMDEVAERGFAAHWRYKGIKGDTDMDEWLKRVRQALETADSEQSANPFKIDLYKDEVFVFTPKGDLLRFPAGSTVLDFAYHIHSNIGNKCVGGRVNGKNVSIREPLRSGDHVEIITQNNQTPKQDWVSIVRTSRAKAKIRFALKETQIKDGLYAKETLARKLKNRKIVLDESVMSRTIRKLGFKENSDFYHSLADERLDVNDVIDKYIETRDHDLNLNPQGSVRSAEEFNYENREAEDAMGKEDVLVIGSGLKGINYSLAKCCHPIYGDPIFGFVTVSGGIKVHCENCPNAPELRRRFGYRIVKAKWSGKGASQYNTTLRVVGNDDIGIVNNITSIISKEEKIVMRSINIDSNDGLFSGNLVVQIEDTARLASLLRKLRTVKGVKSVTRI